MWLFLVMWLSGAQAPSSLPDSEQGLRLFSGRVLMVQGLAGVRTPGVMFAMPFNKDLGVAYRAALGTRLPLLEYVGNTWAVQWSVDGCGWFDLHRTGLLFGLYSGDYLIGTAFSGRYKTWRASLEFNHISAHLGDALFKERAPVNYSREDITLRVSHAYVYGQHLLKGYGYGGFLVRTRPQHLNRGFAAAGFEWRGWMWHGHLRPAVAWESMFHGDTRSWGNAVKAGVVWESSKGAWMDVFLGLTGYHGSDRRGQFVGDKERFWGMVLFFLPSERL